MQRQQHLLMTERPLLKQADRRVLRHLVGDVPHDADELPGSGALGRTQAEVVLRPAPRAVAAAKAIALDPATRDRGLGQTILHAGPVIGMDLIRPETRLSKPLRRIAPHPLGAGADKGGSEGRFGRTGEDHRAAHREEVRQTLIRDAGRGLREGAVRDVAKDTPGGDQLAVLASHRHPALEENGLSRFGPQLQLDQADVLAGQQLPKKGLAMGHAGRIDHRENVQVADLFAGVAQRVAPGEVHEQELTVRPHALDEVGGPVEEIPQAGLAFPDLAKQAPLGERAVDLLGQAAEIGALQILDQIVPHSGPQGAGGRILVAGPGSQDHNLIGPVFAGAEQIEGGAVGELVIGENDVEGRRGQLPAGLAEIQRHGDIVGEVPVPHETREFLTIDGVVLNEQQADPGRGGGHQRGGVSLRIQ